MSEKNRLVSLTRIAFLNALVLSFLSLQFIMPLSMLILIWVLPVIFALEIYYVSPRIVLSNYFGLLLISLLLGFDTAIWMLVYFVVGVVLGALWRVTVPYILRLVVTSMAFVAGFFGLGIIFFIITGANLLWLEEILGMFSRMEFININPYLTLTAGGIVVIILLSVWTNGFMGRILSYLEIEELGWMKGT